jgi:hypothetical protein
MAKKKIITLSDKILILTQFAKDTGWDDPDIAEAAHDVEEALASGRISFGKSQS